MDARVLLLVQATHERVVALIDSLGGDAHVGPTSPAGWTAVWWSGAEGNVEDPALPRPFVVIDGSMDGARLVVHPADTDAAEVRWFPGEARGPVALVAELLAAMLAAHDRLEDITSVLEEPDLDPVSLIEELGQLLTLPELDPSPPDRGVVLHHGDVTFVRIAAAIKGPARLLDVGEGWTALAPAEGGVGPDELAAAVSAGGSRKDRTVLLWRSGAAAGVAILRRGALGGRSSWNEEWTFTGPQVREIEPSAVKALRWAAGQDVDEPTLRALLRRRAPTSDPLLELVGLLGLPTESLALMDAPDTVQDRAQFIASSSVRGALLQQARTAHRKPVPRGFRTLFSVYAVGTAAAAVVTAAMTAVGVATLASDGAFVDQHGFRAEDWLWTAAFAVLTLVLVPTAGYRLRRSWTSWRSDRRGGTYRRDRSQRVR